MRHAFRVLWHLAALLALAVCLFVSPGWSQINFTGPQPGDVYREYTVVLNPNGNNWRVTDPNTSIQQYPSVSYDLPNPVNQISIGDLSGAIRAEAVLSVWGGHVGTTGKKIRFNSNGWISIPELSTQNGIPAGHNGECYMSEPMVTLPVPLSNLVTGTNSFEATTGGQNCYGWGWGMFGIYNVMIRVYYEPSSKPHPTGYISSPTSGGSFGENPTITTAITGGSVNRVDIVASYYGYDTDGDGISTGYHYDYQLPTTNDNTMDIHNHVGTATGSPWQVTWNTQWVPDQAAGGVKFLARIRDNSGVWYCSPEVSNLSLVRSGTSVQMFQTTPAERAWGQGDVGPINLPVTVPSVSGATEAAMFIRSWNMLDVDMEPGDYDYRRFNGNDLGAFGARYYYSNDIRSLPVNQVVSGTNTFSFYSSVTIHHGIEILWPGPALMVRYNGTPSNNPPVITQHPINQTVSVGQTATFSINATGTMPLSYQWQKNNSDIGGATNSTYTTPATTAGDSGATFRCVVRNNYGTATSNSATLIVTTGGGGGGGGGTNVLTNASFESGTANWTFYTNGAGSLSTAGPGTNGALAGRVSIAAAGSNVQLYQAGITLEPNTQYTLSFDAFASAPRTIAISLGQHGSPYANYGLQSKPFSFGTSWQNFSVTFATTGFSGIVNDGRLMFWFADVDAAGDQYTIDNVILAKAGGSTPTGPTITNHPTNQTAAEGQTATFSVGASGTAPLSFQWQKNSGDINGATNSSYTTPAVTPSDNGATFRCVVKNNYGTATSNSATLTVTPGGGGGGGTNVLANASFESGTTGWNFYTNGGGSFGTASPGTDGASAGRISIGAAGTNVQLYQYGFALEAGTQYTLQFDAYASASRAITISLGQHGSPYANYGLNSRPFTLGTSWQTFSVTFTTTGFSGTVTDPRLMIWLADADAAGDVFNFDNFVLSKPGSTTPVGPTITQQPSNQLIAVGQTATFTVGASGTAPLSYQWQKNNGDIGGATSPSYTTPAVTLADDGAAYRCVVKNGYGTATSNAATLTVGTAVNVLANGSFESGTTGWSFYTNGAGGFATVTPGTNGTSAGRVSISAAGTNVQLYQYGFSLDGGTSYTLTFDAYANASRTISISMGKHVSPYTNYGLNDRPVTLGTSWQDFSISFTTSGFSGTVTDPRLMIWFADADVAGDTYYFDNFVLSKAAGGSPMVVASIANNAQMPTTTGISDIYPNPFNPSANIRYMLLQPAVVTLRVYSVLGQEVATLVDGPQGAGVHTIVWDGRNSNGAAMGSGVYLCRMTGAGERGEPIISVKRMMLLK